MRIQTTRNEITVRNKRNDCERPASMQRDPLARDASIPSNALLALAIHITIRTSVFNWL